MRRPMSLPLLLLVVITLLLPLVPPATSAQPAPNPCPEGQVPDNTGVCVPEEDAPPDDPPVDVSAGTIVDLTLLHYACDAGFDPRPGTGDRNASCTGAGKPAFTYTITINDRIVTTVSLQTSDGTRGRADLDSTPDQPLPAGTMVIAGDPVEGWAPVWVFCEIDDAEGGQRTEEPAISGGAVSLMLGAGERAVCDWFNVAAGPGDQDAGEDPAQATGADITIAAYNCPAGTTATDDLIATCAERASGLTFSLLTATETVATQASDAEGDIFFAGVAPNDYGIAAALPTGYGEPIVVCYVADPIGNVFEGQQDVVFGNQIRLRLGDGFSAECAWYNVPAQGPDNGPNIFIQARQCGEGIAISPPMTVFDAEALCPVVYQNKEFQVLFDDQIIATKVTNDDALSSGQVFFTRLPAPNGGGVYGIQATLLEGEQTLSVFCDQNFGGEAFHTVTTIVTDGNRIDQELLEGYTLRCSWFIKINPLLGGTQAASEPPMLDPTSMAATQQALSGTVVPTPTELDPTSMAATQQALDFTPGITVVARLCPPEVAGQDVALDEICTEPASGVTFEILVDDESTGTYVTDPNGEFAIPPEVGQGEYLFRHQPGSDQLELNTVCSSVYANGSTATGQSRVVGPEMSEFFLTYDGASSITCTFYFVLDSAAPEDQATSVADAGEGEGAIGTPPHTLTIQFWTCPVEIDPSADQVNLVQACSSDTEERSFMLTVDGDTMGQTVTGSATWEFLDPTISADLGASLASSAWCTSESIVGDGNVVAIPDQIALDGGLLTVTVSQPATAVYCDWYLFPG